MKDEKTAKDNPDRIDRDAREREEERIRREREAIAEIAGEPDKAEEE